MHRNNILNNYFDLTGCLEGKSRSYSCYSNVFGKFSKELSVRSKKEVFDEFRFNYCIYENHNCLSQH